MLKRVFHFSSLGNSILPLHVDEDVPSVQVLLNT